jgi:hypothetical protein
MHKIKLRILPDGRTEVAVEGVAGPKCSDVTKAVERALGDTTEDRRTAEFLKPAATVRLSNEGSK